MIPGYALTVLGFLVTCFYYSVKCHNDRSGKTCKCCTTVLPDGTEPGVSQLGSPSQSGDRPRCDEQDRRREGHPDRRRKEQSNRRRKEQSDRKAVRKILKYS